MKRILSLLTVALLSLSIVACNNNQTSTTEPSTSTQAEAVEVKTMTGDELVALLADEARFIDALILDVRKPEVYAEGHIKGAINIPLDEFEARISELESYKNKEVVLYCNSGKMSGEAANILVSNGFTNVFNADGVKQYSYELISDVAKAEVKTMTGDELVAILNDPQKLSNSVIIDVRKPEVYAEGHIAGSINISLDVFESKLSELEGHKDKDIILYCNSGKMSGEAANILVEKGFANVFNADGVKQYSYELVK